MKTIYITFIMILIFVNKLFADPKPRFFIQTNAKSSTGGKEAISYMGHFESLVMAGLKKNYPCVNITTSSGIAALISLDRQKCLLTGGDESNLANIASAMGCDYLISLNVTVNNNQAIISAVCLDSRKVSALSRANAFAEHGDDGLDAVEEVAEKLIDGLKYYEICPFTGPVKVEVVSDLVKKEKEEYSVYCNQKEETFKKSTDIINHTESNWALNKKGLQAATGNVMFNISERKKIIEENGCYKCKSGREGGRVYTEKSERKGKIDGLSKESSVKGIAVDDARIKLIFYKDSTYFISITATSEQGDLIVTSELHAEGTCDNVTTTPLSVNKKADIPLKEKFGPFPGIALDKVLTQKQTVTKEDPITKEKTTITFEFVLKHD